MYCYGSKKLPSKIESYLIKLSCETVKKHWIVVQGALFTISRFSLVDNQEATEYSQKNDYGMTGNLLIDLSLLQTAAMIKETNKIPLVNSMSKFTVLTIIEECFQQISVFKPPACYCMSGAFFSSYDICRSAKHSITFALCVRVYTVIDLTFLLVVGSCPIVFDQAI